MERRQKLNSINTTYNKNVDCETIAKALSTNDEMLVTNLNAKICNINIARLNLMEYLLENGELKNNIDDIKHFFNMIQPYLMQNDFSGVNYKKMTNGNTIIQLSTYVNNYCVKKQIINNIELLFKRNKIDYRFFKLTNRRFCKTVDILFVV